MKMRQYTYPNASITMRSVARLAKINLSMLRSNRYGHDLTLGIIGFPKCGTTTLHNSMLQCEQLTGVSHESQARDYLLSEKYKKINFLKNPNLIYEPWWLHALDKQAGPAKYILCLRNPIVALHSFYWYRHKEIQDPASWIPAKNRHNISDEHSVMMGQAELVGACRERVNYHIWIEHLLKVIPHSRVHCVILEELKSDPLIIQQRLSEFLEINIDLSKHYTIANQNTNKPKQSTTELEDLYGSDNFFAMARKKTNELLYNHWGIQNNNW